MAVAEVDHMVHTLLQVLADLQAAVADKLHTLAVAVAEELVVLD
jgi:hypothetical protein